MELFIWEWMLFLMSKVSCFHEKVVLLLYEWFEQADVGLIVLNTHKKCNGTTLVACV